MKHWGHWLSLLCLTISLVWSPAGAPSAKGGGKSDPGIIALDDDKLLPVIVVAEKSVESETVVDQSSSLSLHWGETDANLRPMLRVVADAVGATGPGLRSVALARPANRGPPARA